MHVPPMLTDIVGDPRSLYFNKVSTLDDRADLFGQKAFLLIPNPFLTMYKSLRNLA